MKIFLLDKDYQVIDKRKCYQNLKNNQFGVTYKYSEEEIEILLHKKEYSDHERKDNPNYKIIKDKQKDLIETVYQLA